MHRQALILLHYVPCGILSETSAGFEYHYLAEYQGMPLSLSLPLQSAPFVSPVLHPFFQSLAPEGWLLQRYSQSQRIDEKDKFGIV